MQQAEQWPPKDGHVLISGICDYERLHGKGELKLRMELGLLAGCRDEEIILDHAGGPNVITWVPIMKEGKTARVRKGGNKGRKVEEL